ncbi:hypothetical protein F5884DRAFT_756586 [Xylogone sp. PMI_703]|nr:hypothetical protein F5884DRAFT_756586 [Xylogone sp. PMI_703]
MVETRTKAGVIKRIHYDVKALRELEITASPGMIPGEEEPPAKRPKPNKKRSNQKKPTIPSLPSEEASGFMNVFSVVPTPSDMSGVEFDDIPVFPKLSFGRHEEEGMSKIMRADREAETWEEVRRVHAEYMPRLLPMIENRLARAMDVRNALRDTPENTRIGAKMEDALCVDNRIRMLESFLKNSTFLPERENITAAIDGYKSGQITYENDVYTIIYAGKIVDTAPDYSSFAVNRKERLDRYADLHGHHWLWYESPLKVHADSVPRLARTSQLVRSNNVDGMGCYYINQGFWKRADYVARLPGMNEYPLVPNAGKFSTLPDGRVFCQDEGPKLSFRCMLDSGANHPLLIEKDIEALGIDPEYYAAQSLISYCTPNGDIISRVYELFVYVLDENNNSIVDKNNPVWPLGVKACGSVCPVCVSTRPQEYVNGLEVNQRLSGMLPFLACYISSTPTNNVLFLGEDRRDVLGTHRVPGKPAKPPSFINHPKFPRIHFITNHKSSIPGQRKWDITMPYNAIINNPRWTAYDNPVTTFTHNSGRVIDEDLADRHGSRLTVNRGTNLEVSIDNIPGQTNSGTLNPLATLLNPNKPAARPAARPVYPPFRSLGQMEARPVHPRKSMDSMGCTSRSVYPAGPSGSVDSGYNSPP